MNKLLYLPFLATVAILPGSVKAITPLPSPIIGVVGQSTLDQSAALKSIVKQVEEKRVKISAEMAKIEKELKAKDEELAKEQKKLPEKEFAAKRQAFEKRVHEVQEIIELRRAQVELAIEAAKTQVYNQFIKVAEEVKKEVGANILIYRETVIASDPAFDLTNTVLERLNKALPTVTVVFKSDADVKKQLQQQPAAAQ